MLALSTLVFFEPEGPADSFHFMVQDLGFLTAIFVIALRLYFKRKLPVNRTLIVLSLLFANILCALMISATQSIYTLSSPTQLVDLYKLLKVCIPLAVILLLPDESQRFYGEKINLIFRAYIVATLAICIFQLALPNLRIWEIISYSVHYQFVKYRPFGFVGNPTQASFIALALLSYFCFKKNKIFIGLSMVCLLFHGNKVTMALGFTGILIHFYVEQLKQAKLKLSTFVSILSPIFILPPLFLLTPLGDFVLNAIEKGGDVHTISYRLKVYTDLSHEFLRNSLRFFFLGQPYKDLWSTFDTQIVLLSYRFGIFFMLSHSIMLLLIAFLIRGSLGFFIAILATSMTMINIYHFHIAGVVGIFLAAFLCQPENLRARSVAESD